ncbi:hypothetical protein [Agrococcus sp. SGAir0287]|uniref:hypothetical protein n=1 Tax=Agrococcus sp. SGAir0287 TaxID=2070347 RepID=UPI0010CD2993|nr:hypothetical protein [Agrococcus sp. SGAir0287]QCR18292.1 hypothetical protein C1N71_01550 [Agrococcus sp. SGAir0287]
MIAAYADPERAPLHAVSLSRRDFDRLVEAAGVLVGRDQSASDAQPDVEYFQQRLESSRSLLAALHKHQWGVRARESG